jgi:Zn-dependent peptidase ImmA (M78 family)/DNA-binding XRE family transcriptional regulator
MMTEQHGSRGSIGGTLARNIRDRREQIGLTQLQLAERAGFSAPQIVSSIERGERDVKAVELAAIAQALRCDLLDLFAEEREESPQPAVVAWREHPGEGADEQAARFIQLCEWYALAEEWADAENPCELPEVWSPGRFPRLDWARAVAEDVRGDLGLGSLPAASLYQTLEERCVKIFHFADLRGSAACAWGDFGAGIALNASDVPWRRNFSLAHELFHLITWETLGPDQGDPGGAWSEHVERLANAFASSLLLPESALLERLAAHRTTQGISWRGLVEVARAFAVSSEALLWRLVTLNQITDRQARRLLNDPEFLLLDRASLAPVRRPELMPDRYLRLLEVAYLRGDVSAGRIAEMTGQSLADVHYKLAQLEEDEGASRQLVRLA